MKANLNAERQRRQRYAKDRGLRAPCTKPLLSLLNAPNVLIAANALEIRASRRSREVRLASFAPRTRRYMVYRTRRAHKSQHRSPRVPFLGIGSGARSSAGFQATPSTSRSRLEAIYGRKRTSCIKRVLAGIAAIGVFRRRR